MLHLHRLDDGEALALGHRFARRDEQRDELAMHRRLDHAAGARRGIEIDAEGIEQRHGRLPAAMQRVPGAALALGQGNLMLALADLVARQADARVLAMPFDPGLDPLAIHQQRQPERLSRH